MNKYRNEPCTVGGEKYRSKRERDKHQELLLMQKAGLISDLRREVPFVLAPPVKFTGDARAKPPLRYIADFTAMRKGQFVVFDAKGVRTEAYRIKRHLVLHIHGVEVEEL